MKKKLVLLAFAVTMMVNTSYAQLSWIFNPATGHYYAITPVLNWHEASALAVASGGYLTTVNDLAENQWIANNLMVPAGSHAWIGLNDIAIDGVYEWVNGEPFSFKNFQQNEPNNIGQFADGTAVHMWNLSWACRSVE